MFDELLTLTDKALFRLGGIGLLCFFFNVYRVSEVYD